MSRLPSLQALFYTLIVLLFMCTSCVSSNKQDTASLAQCVVDVCNLRFYGLTEESEAKLAAMPISDDIREDIKSMLYTGEVTERGIFISLENEFKEREVTTELMNEDGTVSVVDDYRTKDCDNKIVTLADGTRGVWSNDILIDEDGQFIAMIYGDILYISVPQEVLNLEFIGNPLYCVTESNYNYFDDGTLLVTVWTDRYTAFDYIYRNVEIVSDTSQATDNFNPDGYLTYEDSFKEIRMSQEQYDNAKEEFLNTVDSVYYTIEAKVDSETGIITYLDYGKALSATS